MYEQLNMETEKEKAETKRQRVEKVEQTTRRGGKDEGYHTRTGTSYIDRDERDTSWAEDRHPPKEKRLNEVRSSSVTFSKQPQKTHPAGVVSELDPLSSET